MKKLRGYTVVAAGILMVGLALSLVGALTVGAVNPKPPEPVEIVNPIPLPVQMRTHLGMQPEEFVMLVRGPGSLLESRFRRVFPNGQPELDTFTVPANKLFVVTDYEFSFIFGPPNTNVAFDLDVVNLVNPNLRYVAHRSSAKSDADGEGASAVTATTGFIVGQGAELIGSVSSASTWGARVRGYLTNAGLPPLTIHASSDPRQETTSIQVTRAGGPVSGAEVNVLGDVDGIGMMVCLASARTDERGTVVIRQALPNTINVTATSPEGETAIIRVTLRTTSSS